MVARFVLVLLLVSAPASAQQESSQQVAVFGNLVPCSDCTIPPPVAVTGAASSLGQTTATIAGTCNPTGIQSQGYFEIGTSPTFELADTATQSLGFGAVPVAIGGGSLSGLSCGTTYLYRAYCEHIPGAGNDWGDTATFDTTACPPTPVAPLVVTSAESGVTSTTATLNGTCDPEGFTAVCRFQWGTSTGNYNGATSPTPDVSVGGGSTAVACSAGISNLSASTTYYTRIQCVNAGGTSNGAEDTLTTSAAPAGKRLLTSADFTLDGSYMLNINGGENQMCLTGRRIAGELYLMTMAAGTGGQAVREFKPSNFALGGTINALTRTWTNVGGHTTTVGNTDLRGCHWAADNKFWTVSAASYAGPTTTNIYTRLLADDQTVSAILGPYLLQGVTQKWAYGGVQEIPAALQASWGGAYLVGWGGATSTLTAAGGTSIGLSAFSMPDPGTLTPSVATTNFSTLANHAGTHGSKSCQLVTCDRGKRLTGYQNYHDNNATINAQSGRSFQVNVAANGVTVTCVTTCSNSTGNFQFSKTNQSSVLAPSWWIDNGAPVRINGVNYTVADVASDTSMTLTAPGTGGALNNVTLVQPNARPLYPLVGNDWNNEIDGVWRHGPYDGYWSNCQLIYEAAAEGFICDFQGDGVAGTVTGKGWYRESNIERDGKVLERHFFNPNHFTEVKAGTRQTWQMQPVEMVAVSLGVNYGQASENLSPRTAVHATYWDSTDKKWWALACRPANQLTQCGLFRYSVNTN